MSRLSERRRGPSGSRPVPGDVASLERDVAGIPITLWHCVNWEAAWIASS